MLCGRRPCRRPQADFSFECGCFSVRLNLTFGIFNVFSSLQPELRDVARASSTAALRGRAGRFPAITLSIMDASSKRKKDSPDSAPQAEAGASLTAKKKPVIVIRVEDVTVPIFAHQNQDSAGLRVNHSWTVQRNFKDSTGRWRHSSWFKPDDFSNVVRAVKEAAEWVRDLENSESQLQG